MLALGPLAFAIRHIAQQCLTRTVCVESPADLLFAGDQHVEADGGWQWRRISLRGGGRRKHQQCSS